MFALRARSSKLLGFINANRLGLALFLAFSAWYGLWWLAFYPGPMTGDSLDQWRQVVTGYYIDAHPFTSTLFLGIFRWLHDTPAWTGLIQVLAMAGLLATSLSYLRHKGVPKKGIAIATGFFVLWPAYSIYTVTIWKDIIFSLAIVAASFVCFRLIAEHKPTYKWHIFAGLSVLAATIALWRVNGIIYLILPFVLVWIFNRNLLKPIAISGIAAIVIYAFMHLCVAGWLNVKPAPIMSEWLRMKVVASIYQKDHPRLSKHERKIFTTLMPESAWKKAYRCNHTDTTFATFYTYDPIGYEDHVSTDHTFNKAWERAVITASAHNLDALVKDRLCLSVTLLGSSPSLIKYAFDVPQRADMPPIKQHAMLHTTPLRTGAVAYLGWTAQGYRSFVFWMALPMFVLMLVYLALAVRLRLWGTAVYAALGLANPLFLIAIGSVSEFRYIYSLILGAPLIPLIYIAERRMHVAKNLGSSHAQRTKHNP